MHSGRKPCNWAGESLRSDVLDRDLGKSGAQITGREDFKTLVADVSMGQVGAVLALEVSRLARSNLDWHRLLELCALTGTLVIDEDGCYDPADFNDGLLLGLKGTMAHAELHLLRGRLLGGKLNKAQKGELRFPLPVGLCYDEDNRIVLDPDEEVRGAVALVFRLFHETGSAFAVVQRFAEAGLRFPKRSYGGAWDGKLIWGRLTHGRVLRFSKTPRMRACMFSADINTIVRSVPLEKYISGCGGFRWQTGACGSKQHHEGYISWKSSWKTRSDWTRTARTAREGAERSCPRRFGPAPGDAAMWSLRPGADGALHGEWGHLPVLSLQPVTS